MELYAEIKLMGDGYAGGFTSGMSMSRSETIEGFSISESIEGETESVKIYKNNTGLILKVHRELDGEAEKVWSEFVNGSNQEVTIEMIASFALKNIEADKIHRCRRKATDRDNRRSAS